MQQSNRSPVHSKRKKSNLVGAAINENLASAAMLIATLTSNKIIEIITLSSSSGEKIKINLNDEKYKYLKLLDNRNPSFNIFTLPGFGNFLFYFGAYAKEKQYFHLHLSREKTPVTTVKNISSIDDNNLILFDMIENPYRKQGWFILSYMEREQKERACCQVFLNEEGKVISRENFLLPSLNSLRDSFDLLPSSTSADNSFHICYSRKDNDNCICSNTSTSSPSSFSSKSNSSKNLLEIKRWFNYVANRSDALCRITDSKTGVIEEVFKLVERPINQGSKVYVRKLESSPHPIVEENITELSLHRSDVNEDSIDNTNTVHQRSVKLPSNYLCSSHFSHFSSGDYLLLHFDKYSRTTNNDVCKEYSLLLLDFFSGTSQVVEEFKRLPNSLNGGDEQIRITLNTNIYNFNFEKIVVETLDKILPRDLINILVRF